MKKDEFINHITNNKVIITKSFIEKCIIHNNTLRNYDKKIYIETLIKLDYIYFEKKLLELLINNDVKIDYLYLKYLGKGLLPKLIFDIIDKKEGYIGNTFENIINISKDIISDSDIPKNKYYYFCVLITKFNFEKIDKNICDSFYEIINMDVILRYLEYTHISIKMRINIKDFIIYYKENISVNQHLRIYDIFRERFYTIDEKLYRQIIEKI